MASLVEFQRTMNVADWVRDHFGCSLDDAENVARVCQRYGVKNFDSISVVRNMMAANFRPVVALMRAWLDEARPEPEDFPEVLLYLSCIWEQVHDHAPAPHISVILDEMSMC